MHICTICNTTSIKGQSINPEFHLEVVKVDIWLPEVVDEFDVDVNLIIGRNVDAIVEPVEGEKDIDVDGEVAVLDPVDVDQEEGVADLEGSNAGVELGHVHRVVGIRKTNLQQVSQACIALSGWKIFGYSYLF